MNSFSHDKPVTNHDFSQSLATIRNQIDNLDIPSSSYTAISVGSDQFQVAECGEGTVSCELHDTTQPDQDVKNWIEEKSQQKNTKYIAMGLTGDGSLRQLGSELWLDMDVVPFLENGHEHSIPEDLAQEVATRFDKDNIVELEIGDHNQVHPSFLVTLDAYKQTATPEEWDKVTQFAKQFRGKKIIFISATPRGGGVALMRHALIRFYRLLGVDAAWHVLAERAEVFEITKGKFHNVLQGVAEESVVLTDDDKELFETWTEENAEMLSQPIKQADVVVIDDPQPSGLIPHVKKMNPDAKIIYRSHIQIDTDLLEDENSPQSTTWNYIWSFAQDADVFVAHPVHDFIPNNVPTKKVVTMPPTTDPLDGLNKNLTEDQIESYLKIFNRMLLQTPQQPLDLNREYLIQIARFDPSKGIPDVIDAYRLLWEKLEADGVPVKERPQLVITGHGSIDDPDGMPLYNLTMEMLEHPMYEHLQSEVRVLRLPHIDQLLNALLRKSKIALQLSHREGFEIKVSEALMKGKPILSYRAGGIPLQIKDEVNGFVVDEIGDTQAVANHLYQLLTDQDLYQQMCQAASEQARSDILTVSNATRWLYLATQLLEQGKLEGNTSKVYDLLFKD
jgi:glycosyltransferase involved in cell wall biosynthesis